MIRSFFGDAIDFEMVGLKDGTREQQLRNFSYALRDAGGSETPEATPKDWLEAFYRLGNFLDSRKTTDKKKVVFIDELPWAATQQYTDFMTGFGYFWNSYASKNNILVIICGSATAWMIQKILNNRGGLHNRVTKKLQIQPFTLAEVEAYFAAKQMRFDRFQILQLYMAFGGIPHYLDQLEGGKSAAQNINEICFAPLGLLRTEFENLYSSLFSRPDRYERVVEALANKWKGLTRTEILKATGMKDGGGFSTLLDELEQSGFIHSYIPFGKKKKNTLFRLSDNYSLFYFKFIKGTPQNEVKRWDIVSQTPIGKSWSGYAFENICFQHHPQIKKALGIAGVFTRVCSFWEQPTETADGVQIDMLIDRHDRSISICEMKFYDGQFALSKSEADTLRNRLQAFKAHSKTTKQLFLVLIVPFGVRPNQHSAGLVDNVVDMHALFDAG